MFTTLNTAVSGMGAAQVGLATTGHNIANVGTRGYSRQRVITKDAFVRTISMQGNGRQNQVGGGVTQSGIQQIRDIYLDAAYRKEATKLDYYDVKTSVGEYVQSVAGEMGGSLTIQGAISDLWASLQEVTQYPESLDMRAGLVSTATIFMSRMSTAYTDLVNYQNNLNEQVKETVARVNELTTSIVDINKAILKAEASGDSANDLRDSLAVALEDLNEIMPVKTFERGNGVIDVYSGDMPLISNGLVSRMGLKYTDQDSGLVEPIFTNRPDIVGYSEESGTPIFKLDGTDKKEGSLIGLLVSRGIRSETYASNPIQPKLTDINPATGSPYTGKDDTAYVKAYEQYRRDVFNVEQCSIPNAMKQLDQIFNRVVTVINDAIAPKDHNEATAPVGMDKKNTQFMELFARIDGSGKINTGGYNDTRYDLVAGEYVFNAEDSYDPATNKFTSGGIYADRQTLYSISNVQINPALMELDGYQMLAFSKNGDLANSDAVAESLDKWNDDFIVFDDGSVSYNITEGYTHVIATIATVVEADAKSFDTQNTLVTQLDNYRQAIMGVSSDEEMASMLQFQRSYQASSRVITMVDSMLDTIINKLI